MKVCSFNAIRYQEDLTSGMPPKSKLADKQIAVLEQWIAMGAPDPRTEPNSPARVDSFDLKSRVADHWSWRKITAPETPPVKLSGWSDSPIDLFIQSNLEQAGLRPAPPADKRIWLRRVYLDLIGLPPSTEQIKAFLADETPESYERVVAELLDSDHYGEKWARHWMDLVRYSETYGHEFDYPIRRAYEYRDYLIRAWNADVPYDQFVREQIAGDMIETPRRHPTEDFNESIIGTGFWYFHDATHAPTDPLGNEADIISNQLDVFSKSFLGLTVACARCHDHKFDAISTADYYALSAYIQSSCRQYAPLDPGRRIETANAKIESYRSQADTLLQESIDVKSLDAERLQQLAKAAEQQQLVINTTLDTSGSDLLEDFGEAGLPPGWTTSGPAFQAVTDQLLTADGGSLKTGTVSSRVLGRKQRGILRSPTFEIASTNIHLRIKATADIRVQVVMDNYQMAPFNALLFKGTFIQKKETETNGQWQWKTLGGDLRKYTGHKAYLEFIDEGDGFIEIDEIRMSNQAAPLENHDLFSADSIADHWKQEVKSLQAGRLEPLLAWMIETGKVSVGELVGAAGESIAEAQHLADQVPKPRYVLAMAQGTQENAKVYVRGNHKSLGDVVPPRFLEALGGRQADRLGLANMVASADNPLTARVIVNRLWHHLFGRGIVPSVDDFGPQGQPPSHPRLLDHLASDLIANGWSLKQTLSKIVLSQTYRQQSVPHPDLTVEQIAATDPVNALLHKMPVRRLSSETIRDCILSVSGRLDRKQYGPSVPTHLTSFMTGRGRPSKSGPLDGNGRRSVYLAVTRNFLNPFMLTFDMPGPFGPQGKRSRSNVPAQALALLNDPFVGAQASFWADRILAMPELDDRRRASLMMEQAHGVQPTPDQADAMVAFVATQSEAYGSGDRSAWIDLAHSLFNMKAFYYVR